MMISQGLGSFFHYHSSFQLYFILESLLQSHILDTESTTLRINSVLPFTVTEMT